MKTRAEIRALSLGLAVVGLCAAARADPAHDRQAVAGLAAPGEIIVDPWGIPPIYAASQRDAFFLHGYNAVRGRLWPIDLWRKRGVGRLSASFGPGHLAQDRAARLLLYRGDMAAEWAAHDHWDPPPLNLVFADTKGDIGWAGSDLTPAK